MVILVEFLISYNVPYVYKLAGIVAHALLAIFGMLYLLKH